MTLNQCLDYFVKEEVLDKEDAWKCPQCKKKRKALKQLTLTKLPDILLIHLKRFSIDGLFRNKLDTMVKCPIRYDILTFLFTITYLYLPPPLPHPLSFFFCVCFRSLDLSGYVPMSITPSPPQDRPSFIYDLYAVSVSRRSKFLSIFPFEKKISIQHILFFRRTNQTCKK